MSEDKIEKKVQKRTIESREKLLKAAFDLFVEKGYYYTNTKEIVKRAGISIGNFYNYFKDKADIYNVLSEQYVDDSISAITELIHGLDQLAKEEAYDYLSKYFHTQLVRCDGVNRFFDDGNIVQRENAELAAMFAKKEEVIIEILEGALRKHRKSIGKASYLVMGRMLYVTINEVASDIIKIKDEGRREEYIQALIDFTVNYVYG